MVVMRTKSMSSFLHQMRLIIDISDDEEFDDNIIIIINEVNESVAS